MEIIKAQKDTEIFSIQEESQIGDVRRYVSYLARELNFTEIEVTNAAIVVTEIGTNLIKHTSMGGDVLVQAVIDNKHVKLELLALDKGPGIAQLGLCLQDGYSTTQTQGTGLGAIQRLSTVFDIYTQPQQGTVLLAQLWHEHSLTTLSSIPVDSQQVSHSKIGSLCLAMPGETVCGDGWGMHYDPVKAIHTVLLSDGLGHGVGAQEATQAALEIFHLHGDQDISSLFQLFHKALRKTRGAAIAIAQINWEKHTLDFAGIGNIEGKVITSLKNYSLFSKNGIVGHEFRHVQLLSYTFEAEMMLILHSDGIKNRWDLTQYPGLLAKHPSIISGVLYRDYQRGRDDASIVMIKF